MSNNLSIGSYLVKYGTSDSDSYISSPGVAYLGREGSDSLTASGYAIVAAENSLWSISNILIGGSGKDKYYCRYRTTSIIFDANSDKGDTLTINESTSSVTRFFTLDNRHLCLFFASGGHVVLVDGMNNKGSMESIHFSNASFSGTPESISGLLYLSEGNYSIEQSISMGLFNPKVMGVNSASEVRDLVDKIYSNSTDYLNSASTQAKEATNVSDLILREQYQLSTIKDYDGNWHGYLGTSAPEAVKSTYKYQGKLDVNNDGITEAIFTNRESGRWVTASIDPITGAFDYSNHGQGGTTRIVGIYEDPLVQAGLVEKNSDLDGSRTFINDLKLDNLILKTVGDYDGDGFQEVYWSKVDNTAYLRAVMHADGNIQYANYQNLDQMTTYLTGHGFANTVALIA